MKKYIKFLTAILLFCSFSQTMMAQTTTTIVNGVSFEYSAWTPRWNYKAVDGALKCGRTLEDWVNSIEFRGSSPVIITLPYAVNELSFLLGGMDSFYGETVTLQSINNNGGVITLSTENSGTIGCLIKDGNTLKPTSFSGSNGKVIITSDKPFTTVTLSITGPLQFISILETNVSICPSTAPTVTSPISNICPANTVNLNNQAHTGTTPAETNLVWYTTVARTAGTEVSTPTAVGNGTYYAFYHSVSGACYSPASNAVTVNITPCCTAGTIAPSVTNTLTNNCASSTPTTVDLASAHTGTAPAGTSIVWYTTATRENGTEVTNSTTAGSGTYYAFYYDEDNTCHSPASQPVTVTINDCADCTDSGITSVDLTTLFDPADLPHPDVVVEWWTTPTRVAGTKVNNPTQVTSGTYYAFFFDTVNNCYNTDNSTSFVVVNILPPCTNVCVKPGDFTENGLPTKVGITVQQKQASWPENIPNGFITLESKEKGFVITRVPNEGSIADPKEGMLIYDIAEDCVKLYNGTVWNCLEQSCND